MFVISCSSHGTQVRGARKDAGTEIWFIQKKESLAGGGRRAAERVILGAMASSLPARAAAAASGAGTAGTGSAGTGSAGAGSAGAGSAGARTEDLRQTAARLFERRGYAATTISDIAEAAGILPGSLYHHFASQEDIVADLLTSYSQALAELGAAAGHRTAGAGSQPGTSGPAGPEGPEALIRRLAADVAALAFRHAAAVRLSAYEAPSVAT